ncbi:MAG: hypothetical protein ACKO7N_07695 [Candidatus Nitrosotenuis sp.]
MSSAGIDTNVNIIINAEDNASSVVSSTTQTIEQRFKAHRTQLKAVRMEYELNHRGLLTTMRAMQSVGMVVNRAVSIYNSWNLMQLRIQTANKNLADSQRNLNQIIDEYGMGSPEHIRALEEEAKMKKEVADASNDAKIQFGLMVISMIADTTRIVTSVIPRLRLLLGMIKTINRTPVITPTTPIGTPTPIVSPTSSKNKVGKAIGIGGPAITGITGGFLIHDYVMGPGFNNSIEEKAYEEYASGSSGFESPATFILNLSVRTQREATQIVDNFFKTFAGGQ